MRNRNKKLKIGIIGLGVGRNHLSVFNSHPQCKVIVACDFSENRLSAIRKFHPDIKVTKKAAVVLQDPLVDMVSIASYDEFHFDQVMQAIQHGKDVFVEKPLCLHRNEAISIKQILEENPDIQLSSNFNLRSCPLFIWVKEAINSGEMGDIFYLEGDYLWGRIQKLVNGWRKEMEFYSIIHGAAVHMIDLIMWLTEMKPVEVQCYGNQIPTADSGLKYNDFAAILLKFENAVIAKVTANGGCVHPHFHKLSVFGTGKTFVNDYKGAKLFKNRDPEAEPDEIKEEYPAVEERARVITSFVEAVLDPKVKAMVSCDDTFKTMSVCFSAEKAMREGRPIRVEYI